LAVSGVQVLPFESVMFGVAPVLYETPMTIRFAPVVSIADVVTVSSVLAAWV
jgi:hypothetical protein